VTDPRIKELIDSVQGFDLVRDGGPEGMATRILSALDRLEQSRAEKAREIADNALRARSPAACADDLALLSDALREIRRVLTAPPPAQEEKPKFEFPEQSKLDGYTEHAEAVPALMNDKPESERLLDEADCSVCLGEGELYRNGKGCDACGGSGWRSDETGREGLRLLDEAEEILRDDVEGKDGGKLNATERKLFERIIRAQRLAARGKE